MLRKNILFYGDSNTHGTKPLSDLMVSERYTENERWTGLLKKKLPSHWNIIEEGLPARTTVHDDPIEGEHKNGFKYLRPCLESHRPIDVFAVMLGTNDLKARFSLTAADIAYGVHRLIEEVKACRVGPQQSPPKIIVLCPTSILEIGALGDIFIGGANKSKELSPFYQKVARWHDAKFFDVGSVIKVSNIDGIHFDIEQQENLATALVQFINTNLL